MDSTLVQIINEWLAVSAEAARFKQENEQLRAQVAELQKPKAEVIPAPFPREPIGVPVMDAVAVNGDSA